MMRLTVALFASLIFCWNSVPSEAAQISCSIFYGADDLHYYSNKEEAKKYWPSGRMPVENATCHFGLLSGEIVKGDYDKVAAFLKTNHPFLREFFLESPGGDADEAMRIGRLFRKYLVETAASDPACASACALIRFGGVERGGKVGVHRPKINDPMFRGLSAADASNIYRQVLERIAAYLDEMEVPKAIIGLMIDTGSSDIRWVHADDALDRPPSLAEWEDASCGSSSRIVQA